MTLAPYKQVLHDPRPDVTLPPLLLHVPIANPDGCSFLMPSPLLAMPQATQSFLLLGKSQDDL